MNIFLSYSHKNKTEAESIDSTFKNLGYPIIRDIRDVPHKDDLHDFCDRIRDCQAAITLISDDYLKSYWCMYEILQLRKERNFKDKIFPIVLDDARIFSAAERADYIQYWQDEYERLKTKADNIDRCASSEIDQDLRLFDYLKNEIGTFIDTIGNWLLWKYQDQTAVNFRDIIQALGLSDLQLLKQVMSAYIKQELDNKLKGTEYVPMDLEYGTIPEKKDDKDREQLRRLEHGRKWERFHIYLNKSELSGRKIRKRLEVFR